MSLASSSWCRPQKTAAAVRHFDQLFQKTAVRWRGQPRKRLDDYDSLDAKLRLEKAPEDFMRYNIGEMMPHELAITAATAAKIRIKNDEYWRKMANACRDAAWGMRPKHVTLVADAFAKMSWRDEQLYRVLAKCVASNVTDYKGVWLAFVARSFSKLAYHHGPLFDLIGMEVPKKLDGMHAKGVIMLATSYGDVQHVNGEICDSVSHMIKMHPPSWYTQQHMALLIDAWGNFEQVSPGLHTKYYAMLGAVMRRLFQLRGDIERDTLC